MVLLLFWAAAAFACYSVFDPRYFDPEHLVGLERQVREVWACVWGGGGVARMFGKAVQDALKTADEGWVVDTTPH